MAVEHWILVGTRNTDQQSFLRKAIIKSGYRNTCVNEVDEYIEMIKRRTFLCAFLERDFLLPIVSKHALLTPTYIVFIASPKDVPKAQSLHCEEKIHDWFIPPIDDHTVKTILTRAKIFFRMSGELDSIKTAAAKTIKEDAAILCTGKWADEALKWIDKVRNQSHPILLAGEAGCGKRLLAKLLHYDSQRASAPFVVMNCQNKDLSILEREIFGEIPPRDRPPPYFPLRSKFSLAANGTILFDKVEHLHRRLQQRLAQAITTRTFSPTGGGDKLKLDARLVFTVQETNGTQFPLKFFHRDLVRMFRQSVLRIPPLRERQVDLSLIVRSVLDKLRREFGIRSEGITEEALDLLKSQNWPGNIRELEGVLWAASILAGRSNISLKALTPFLSNGGDALKDEEKALEEIIEDRLNVLFRRFEINHLKDVYPMVIERVEKPLLCLVLRETHGNRVRAASILGINRNTLRKKLEFYGMKK